MRKLMVTALAALAAAQLWAIQGTLSTETDRKTGDIKWNARQKLYVVSIQKGKSMIDMEFKAADVVALDIPKPANFDQAVQLVENGQGAGAVAALTKIVNDYRMLQWDKTAGRYLAMAYIASEQYQKAYDICAPIVAEDPDSAFSGDLAPAYWQSLLKLGKLDQLRGLLDRSVSSGDRRASAAALVMRGDIVLADGNDTPDQLKTALRDGYLRVALMYRDAACARERRDALNKAAACFDKLGQSSRAEKLRAEAKAI